MKKTFYILVIFITFFIIYFLQSNLCNIISINNIKPNLFLIYAVFLGITFNKYIAYPMAIIMGLFIDLVVGQCLGIYAIGLGLTALIANLLNNKINRINRITTTTIIAILTIMYNVIIYTLNIIVFSINIEIIQFIKVSFVEMLYNCVIFILLYPMIRKKIDVLKEKFEFKNTLI